MTALSTGGGVSVGLHFSVEESTRTLVAECRGCWCTEDMHTLLSLGTNK